MSLSVKKLKTSEVCRTGASWLEGASLAPGVKRREAVQMLEVAAELRVRARWIEVARTDKGVSEERRLAVAAIEDVEGRR